MKKSTKLFIIIGVALAIIIFIIASLKCKEMADTIPKEVYESTIKSPIVNKKIGPIDSAYAKNIYNLCRNINEECIIDLKLKSKGKTYYIKAVVQYHGTLPVGYIIKGKKYDEFQTFNIKEYSEIIEKYSSNENIGTYKNYKEIIKKVNTIFQKKYNADLKYSTNYIYYDQNSKNWLVRLKLPEQYYYHSYNAIIDEKGQIIALWEINLAINN